CRSTRGEGFCGKARHSRGYWSQDESRVGGEITRSRGIEGVFCCGIKAQLIGDGHWVELQGRTCKRTRAIWRNSQTLVQVLEAIDIAKQGLGMSEQRMYQQDGLCRLRVRLARQGGVGMPFRLAGDSFDEVADLQRNIADGIAHPHAK